LLTSRPTSACETISTICGLPCILFILSNPALRRTASGAKRRKHPQTVSASPWPLQPTPLGQAPRGRAPAPFLSCAGLSKGANSSKYQQKPPRLERFTSSRRVLHRHRSSVPSWDTTRASCGPHRVATRAGFEPGKGQLLTFATKY
jgi:hypothetical protein